jgi:hypothetical protein
MHRRRATNLRGIRWIVGLSIARPNGAAAEPDIGCAFRDRRVDGAQRETLDAREPVRS